MDVDDTVIFSELEEGSYEVEISGAGNVSVRNGSRLQLSNSTLRYSKSFGLYVEGSSDLPNFSSNLFTENEVAAAIPTTLMGAPDGNSDYTGNTNDYVLVEEQDVSEDMTISALNVPYRVENTPNIEGDAQVTVKAGVTMEFKANTGIRVYSDNEAANVSVRDGSNSTIRNSGAYGGWADDGTCAVSYSGNSYSNNPSEIIIIEIQEARR